VKDLKKLREKAKKGQNNLFVGDGKLLFLCMYIIILKHIL